MASINHDPKEKITNAPNDDIVTNANLNNLPVENEGNDVPVDQEENSIDNDVKQIENLDQENEIDPKDNPEK
ncbi:MAG: hypothetical protein EOP00_07250 [Pedobacter sp.]|nr:MAG: hypothetical protein EOP00_07250 [Pedobacter sp.]